MYVICLCTVVDLYSLDKVWLLVVSTPSPLYSRASLVIRLSSHSRGSTPRATSGPLWLVTSLLSLEPLPVDVRMVVE
jgi:hypothetical protein